mgnify:CR=1 FL=1
MKSTQSQKMIKELLKNHEYRHESKHIVWKITPYYLKLFSVLNRDLYMKSEKNISVPEEIEMVAGGLGDCSWRVEIPTKNSLSEDEVIFWANWNIRRVRNNLNIVEDLTNFLIPMAISW